MFEIGDKVWYRGAWGSQPPVAAVITGSSRKHGATAFDCQVTGQYRGSWGYLHQFESRACHLCGEPTAEPGCPLCTVCSKEFEELEKRDQDARDEREQRRRPL